jgi:hypothetical protein
MPAHSLPTHLCMYICMKKTPLLLLKAGIVYSDSILGPLYYTYVNMTRRINRIRDQCTGSPDDPLYLIDGIPLQDGTS